MNIDPREWELQERALREVREGTIPAGEAGAAGYRLVARALRKDPGGPPPGFAEAVAAAAARPSSPAARATEEGIERWLLRCLAATFGVSCVGAVAIYGADWVAGFLAILPVGGATAINWVLAAAACLGLSWGFGWLRPRATA